MAIAIVCSGCGHAYQVPDEKAGKSGTCKRCGARFTVPGGASTTGGGDAPRMPWDEEEEGRGGGGYHLNEPSAALPRLRPRAGRPGPEDDPSPMPAPVARPKAKRRAKGDGFDPMKTLGSIVTFVVVVGLFILRVYVRYQRDVGHRDDQGNPVATGPAQPSGSGGGFFSGLFGGSVRQDVVDQYRSLMTRMARIFDRFTDTMAEARRPEDLIAVKIQADAMTGEILELAGAKIPNPTSSEARALAQDASAVRLALARYKAELERISRMPNLPPPALAAGAKSIAMVVGLDAEYARGFPNSAAPGPQTARGTNAPADPAWPANNAPVIAANDPPQSLAMLGQPGGNGSPAGQPDPNMMGHAPNAGGPMNAGGMPNDAQFAEARRNFEEMRRRAEEEHKQFMARLGQPNGGAIPNNANGGTPNNANGGGGIPDASGGGRKVIPLAVHQATSADEEAVLKQLKRMDSTRQRGEAMRNLAKMAPVESLRRDVMGKAEGLLDTLSGAAVKGDISDAVALLAAWAGPDDTPVLCRALGIRQGPAIPARRAVIDALAERGGDQAIAALRDYLEWERSPTLKTITEDALKRLEGGKK